MDAEYPVEERSKIMRNPGDVSSTVTRARRSLTGRNVAFWSTLAIAPVAFGAGITAAMGSRRAGLIVCRRSPFSMPRAAYTELGRTA